MSKLRVLVSGEYELRMEYEGEWCVLTPVPPMCELHGTRMPARFADDMAAFLLGTGEWKEQTDGG